MHACLWKLWDENLDDINTTITCHWNKIPKVANYSLFLAKELDDLKRQPVWLDNTFVCLSRAQKSFKLLFFVLYLKFEFHKRFCLV